MTLEQKTKLEKEFTAAYNEYKKDLCARALFKVSNQALSEDLVQTTFMKTWNYLMRGGKIDTMKAFLHKILNNLIVDEYRKHKPVSLDVMIKNGFEPSVDESNRVFNILDGKSAFRLIRRLPKKYQKIMMMKYQNDLTLGEISEINKQPKNTVAVQLHRGLEKVKMLYATS